MPRLRRPDGAELHWEERGSGPLVVTAFACLSSPAVFHALIDGLAGSHRAVTYDPRGFGQSTPDGPYDPQTDADDLAALLEELGGDLVVVPTGDACNRAVRVAAAHPELVRAIVTPGGNPLGRGATVGTDALAASDSVIEMLVQTMRTDYRAALRTAIGSANVQLDESAVRERVNEQAAYAPQDVTLARLLSWIDDALPEEGRAVGDKLWMLEHPNNPWFPIEIAERTRALLPEAHVVEVPDGALSRPQLTVEVVSRLTAPQASAAPGVRPEV
jgi:pimeloyl-ACP methyl ester carboxylesterase